MKIPNYLKLIIAVFVSELAGVIGSFFTMPSINNWYATLVRPPISPPNWVFGPVWTTLFALMGVAAFLVWSSFAKASEDKQKALSVFILQLALNVIWSIIFFGFKSPFFAFVDIVALWLAIFWTMTLFYRVSKSAMWLLVPYIFWVTFAMYLNFAIWTLN